MKPTIQLLWYPQLWKPLTNWNELCYRYQGYPNSQGTVAILYKTIWAVAQIPLGWLMIPFGDQKQKPRNSFFFNPRRGNHVLYQPVSRDAEGYKPSNYCWLVVYLQLGWWHSQNDGKVIKFMFQSTIQLLVFIYNLETPSTWDFPMMSMKSTIQRWNMVKLRCLRAVQTHRFVPQQVFARICQSTSTGRIFTSTPWFIN